MARTVSLAKQWQKEIVRVIQREVPKIIVEHKMKPLAKQMWSRLIENTARDTGRLQHFYTPYLVTGTPRSASARAPAEVFGQGRIHKKDHYPPASPSAGHVEAERLTHMRQLYTITSGIPYAEEVETNTHKTATSFHYRKPRMMKRTAEFIARNAKWMMR